MKIKSFELLQSWLVNTYLNSGGLYCHHLQGHVVHSYYVLTLKMEALQSFEISVLFTGEHGLIAQKIEGSATLLCEPKLL